MLCIPFVLHKACTNPLLDSSLRFCEPYSRSFNGMSSIVDKLAEWLKLIPMVVGEGELSTSTVIHLFFNHIVHSFGVPYVVLYD